MEGDRLSPKQHEIRVQHPGCRRSYMTHDGASLNGAVLFEFLNEEDRGALAARLVPVAFPAGETIFRSGDPGDSLFIICKGAVEIFIRDDTGQKIVLEHAKAGDTFGELSMLDSGPRSASATVTH